MKTIREAMDYVHNHDAWILGAFHGWGVDEELKESFEVLEKAVDSFKALTNIEEKYDINLVEFLNTNPIVRRELENWKGARHNTDTYKETKRKIKKESK